MAAIYWSLFSSSFFFLPENMVHQTTKSNKPNTTAASTASNHIVYNCYKLKNQADTLTNI